MFRSSCVRRGEVYAVVVRASIACCSVIASVRVCKRGTIRRVTWMRCLRVSTARA